MTHPAIRKDGVALITGGAAGIGLAVARRLAAAGMKLVIVDTRAALFDEATAALAAAGAPDVAARAVDVADRAALEALRGEVADRFGALDVLMCNAGIQPGSALFGPVEDWRRVIGVNLWGVIHATQVFAPAMVAAGRPGLIVNTGSKQGITTPPGDPAYNVSKCGVKAFTEALAHEVRNTAGAAVSVHLLIPGFVFTDLTRRGRAEKPAGAWTPDQTADFMFDSLARGDFYILCPDNDVDRPTDEKRMAWAMGDIIENRPPLSRWHPDYAEAFAAYLKAGG